MDKFTVLMIGIALIVLAAIFTPLILIYAVNTLVAAGGVATFVIPYTIDTWFAALLVMALMRGSASVSSS